MRHDPDRNTIEEYRSKRNSGLLIVICLILGVGTGLHYLGCDEQPKTTTTTTCIGTDC